MNDALHYIEMHLQGNIDYSEVARIACSSLTRFQSPVVKMEELSNAKVISFKANCMDPETQAWNQMRHWVVQNLNDYEARRYLGYAPVGHHSESEIEAPHEYVVMMLLYGEEGQQEYLAGEKVCDAPAGLFLVGDVVLNEFDEKGNIDIGENMKKSSQAIYESMLDMKYYSLDFEGRTYLEEVVFPKEWFLADESKDVQAEYKFWLPIKK